MNARKSFQFSLRPVEGKIKTCTLRQNASGEWTVSFSCKVAIEPRAIAEESIGIDVGLQHFATFSTGQQKESKKIIDRYQIADASWNQFLQYLFYKAAEAGRKIGFVNPAYTTQECCKCGTKYFSPRTGWPGSNP